MMQTFKWVLLGIWIGSVATFAWSAFVLIPHEDSIRNASGEVAETVAGIGAYLLLALCVFSLVAPLAIRWSRGRKGRVS